MSFRVVVPELLKEARGVRSIDEIVAASGKRFTRSAYSMWENGQRKPLDKYKVALIEALGVRYEKISLPIDQIPKDSKFFIKSVHTVLT